MLPCGNERQELRLMHQGIIPESVVASSQALHTLPTLLQLTNCVLGAVLPWAVRFRLR